MGNQQILFLQMMIHCLNINGRCSTVMLNGQKMYGTWSGYGKVREYLLKSCDLHEVISCPSGTFTSTSSKTCILLFTKKKERKDVVEIIGNKRELKFCDSFSTQNVKFYDFNPDTEEKIFIKELSIEEISANKCSLFIDEYLSQQENIVIDNVELIPLNNLCNIQIGGTPRRDNSKYYGGNNLWVSVKELNNGVIYDTKEYITDLGVENSNVKLIPENTILYSFKLSIGKLGISGKPLYTNEAIAGLIIKEPNRLLTKFLYYALSFINSNESKGCIGKGSLNKKSLGELKFPLIPIDKQQRIIEFLDSIYPTSTILNFHIKQTIEYYESEDLFQILLSENFELYNYLIITQKFNIKPNKIKDLLPIGEELIKLQELKNMILSKVS